MTDLLHECAIALGDAGFSTNKVEVPAGETPSTIATLSFEDATVIGFIIAYDTVDELIARWKSDGDRVAIRHRAALQAAKQKAWNTYLVLLSPEAADFGQSLVLGQIEEDLEAMRKITKSGVTGPAGAHNALLPLLPFRAAPALAPVDMREEIKGRTTELDDQLVAGFLSSADENVLMQLLEDRA